MKTIASLHSSVQGFCEETAMLRKQKAKDDLGYQIHWLPLTYVPLYYANEQILYGGVCDNRIRRLAGGDCCFSVDWEKKTSKTLTQF